MPDGALVAAGHIESMSTAATSSTADSNTGDFSKKAADELIAASACAAPVASVETLPLQDEQQDSATQSRTSLSKQPFCNSPKAPRKGAFDLDSDTESEEQPEQQPSRQKQASEQQDSSDIIEAELTAMLDESEEMDDIQPDDNAVIRGGASASFTTYESFDKRTLARLVREVLESPHFASFWDEQKVIYFKVSLTQSSPWGPLQAPGGSR